jgi:4-hydroxythreonine-4-phosphate dehydrogenase
MMGDFTGIGPEQCARVLADKRLSDAARLVVVGDTRVLAQGQRDAGVRFEWRTYKTPQDVDWDADEVPIIDLGNLDPALGFPRGVVSAASGRITGETLAVMVEMSLQKRIDGIVFAPLNKKALHEGGWKFNDEHQMFAHLTGHKGFFGEMNVLDNKWMSRVTSHVSLREAIDQINPERIDNALTLADATMRGAGFANPRIAVAALNPHGGENGLFGREEIEIIKPAVDKAAARGINCKGPLPLGHGVHQGLRRRVRRRPFHVPRPGTDRDQAEGLQSRRHRHRRVEDRVLHAGPRHRLRHRRKRRRHHRRTRAGGPSGGTIGFLTKEGMSTLEKPQPQAQRSPTMSRASSSAPSPPTSRRTSRIWASVPSSTASASRSRAPRRTRARSRART